ncbi:MAG TPA: hypothetical protein VHF89_14320 [Solirubrobacteraceae bacterium]|nr:hypothetical protein [Solirubrobacteraceae bacterium]
MDPGHPLLTATSLTLTPEGRNVEVADDSGHTVATLDASGALRGPAGETLLALRLEEPSGARRDRPGAVQLHIADPGGATELGTATVTKYGFGPRSKKLSLAVGDAVRFDVSDDRGTQLAITAGGAEVGTLSIETIKKGFLRRARVYRLQIASPPPPDLHALVLGAAIGYESMLDAALAAAMRD